MSVFWFVFVHVYVRSIRVYVHECIHVIIHVYIDARKHNHARVRFNQSTVDSPSHMGWVLVRRLPRQQRADVHLLDSWTPIARSSHLEHVPGGEWFLFLFGNHVIKYRSVLIFVYLCMCVCI